VKRTSMRQIRPAFPPKLRDREPAEPPTVRPLVRGSYGPCEGGGAVPKEPQPVRDEAYRRLVASLPCFNCGIHGHSQCAHPNTGKTKGRKLSDDRCFPLCADRVGVVGCHSRFDRYELTGRDGMAAFEASALAWTTEQLKESHV
jgi:hypothetical protein